MADSAAESEDALWLAAGGPLQCLYFRSYALSRITYDAEKSAPPDAKTRTAILNSACRAAYMAALSRAPLADGTTAASLVSAAWALHLLGALRRCNQSLLPAWAGELAKRALVVAEASLEASSSGHVFEPWAECLNAKDRATISLALPRKPRVGGLTPCLSPSQEREGVVVDADHKPSLNFGLAAVVYEWARGVSFREITQVALFIGPYLAPCLAPSPLVSFPPLPSPAEGHQRAVVSVTEQGRAVARAQVPLSSPPT